MRSSAWRKSAPGWSWIKVTSTSTPIDLVTGKSVTKLTTKPERPVSATSTLGLGIVDAQLERITRVR